MPHSPTSFICIDQTFIVGYGCKAVPNRPKIFIGSPTEDRELASTIARALAEKGFVPMRWWKEFPSGSYPLERLIEIAGQVDGAVLIGTGVDVVVSRTIETAAPRDNVILEYGLFVGALGRERCMLLIDAGAKLPSDVLAITHLRVKDDAVSVGEDVAKHFDNYFGEPRLPENADTPVIADQKIVEISLNEAQQFPREWHQRQLYYGPEGAANWLRLCDDSRYLDQEFHEWNRMTAMRLAKGAGPATVISLGPGDAKVDAAMLKSLRSTDASVRYIPVDICEPLLFRAIARLSPLVSVPVGILGDFEERLEFIARQVYAHGKRPFLFSLLGGTLGNFDDGNEIEFLLQLRSYLTTEDRVLLGVSLAGENWSKENDARCHIEKFDPVFLRFICAGVSKSTGKPIEECVNEFATMGKLKVRTMAGKNGTRPHRILEYWWSSPGKAEWLCTRICRYSLELLKSQLRQIHYEVLTNECETLSLSSNGSVDYALFLLRPMAVAG